MASNNVVYICSDNRAGSTLLDMLLGRHPLLTSVGELHHLYAYLNGIYYRQTSNENTCTCEKKVWECSFWSRVISYYNHAYKADLKLTRTRFPISSNPLARFFFDFYIATVSIHKLKKKIDNKNEFADCKEIALNRFKLYEAINCVNKTLFVVDSSKRIEGLKFLLAVKEQPMKVIFLTRDLRAIAVSKFKRQVGSKLSVMMLQTMLFRIKLFLVSKTVPGKQRLVLNYEDIAANPQKSLRRIFLFLGIDADINIDLESYCESHVLGASPHRLTNKNLKIFIDNQWKENISFFHKPLSGLLVLTQKIFNIKS